MSKEFVLLVTPLVVLELILKLVCLRDWMKREQVNGLSRTAWLLIFLFVNLFGPIAYLVYGRKHHGHD
ncbi:MAG: PLDc_N domain-containing protein [Spirochaetales bacterium]|nr:PLDc_N domain-containing protein [Spirochaetales bacterium]